MLKIIVLNHNWMIRFWLVDIKIQIRIILRGWEVSPPPWYEWPCMSVLSLSKPGTLVAPQPSTPHVPSTVCHGQTGVKALARWIIFWRTKVKNKRWTSQMMTMRKLVMRIFRCYFLKNDYDDVMSVWYSWCGTKLYNCTGRAVL